MTRNETDIAWKDLLEVYLKNFVDYCLPDISILVDWEKKWTSLDKELEAITKGQFGRCLADKLFKLFLKNGEEQWFLIHIEIQSEAEVNFPQRMFIYGYRIYDRYRKSIASCAILTDKEKDWRPNFFKIGLGGSYLCSQFLVIKLIDYWENYTELENSNDIFANVILIQLQALKNKLSSSIERKIIKFKLTKRLYEKKFSRVEILSFYQFIDWLIGLPKELDIEYLNEVQQLEEARNMPYITFAERYGIEKGLKQGLRQGSLERELEIARRLLSEQVDISIVARATGLSPEKIQEIAGEKV